MVWNPYGGPLPFVRLRSLFGFEQTPPAREDVLVVRHGADTLGFVVDSLEGAQRTVVKPLGPLCRGTAGVSGSAFVALAATLSSIHTVPVAGMALLLGIERFMSMARGTTNMIGNF